MRFADTDLATVSVEVFTGVINEYTANGEFVRTSPTASGEGRGRRAQQRIAPRSRVAPDGTLYFGEIGS